MTSDQITVFQVSAVITSIIQLGGFSVAYAKQTEKFYDILGGLNYLVLAFYSATTTTTTTSDHDDDDHDHDHDETTSVAFLNNPRKLAMTFLFTMSRLWLLLFLAWRAHERNGDARFDNVKDKFGWFLVFWIVQGLWVLLISMPLLFVNSSFSSSPELSSAGDYMTLTGFAVGIIMEITSDVQKAIWVKAGRSGGFCACGLWKYSRHPNYFGEILQWTCAWLFALGSSSSGGGFTDKLWWSCSLSPLFTIHILLNTKGTGVWNAEGQNLKRYYDNQSYADSYTDYRHKTSILIPMIGYQYVPLWIKRTFLLEWKRYEYNLPEETKKLLKKNM